MRDLAVVCSHLRGGCGEERNISKKTFLKNPQWEGEKHWDDTEVPAV